ncbi:MAG: GGDEF domain-containing protein [Nitrospiraceae bacterium]|nr:MAG: GGDEF domain-containing protein [Nitrospiraceae bacterium]
MDTFAYISTIETIGGAAILFFSLIAGLKIKNPGVASGKWNHLLIMAAFLFIGMASFAFFHLFRMHYAQELVTGSIFLLCACAVYSFVIFTKTCTYHFQMEIAALMQNEDRLKASFSNDELTGLHSKHVFFTLMSNHIKIISRQKKKALVFYLDIDNLKQINETLGFQEGDLMLIETSNILRATFRRSDIIARIAGDEFAVFLVGASDHDSDSILESFSENLKKHNEKRMPQYQLSITYGLASFDPQFNDSIDSVLKQAYDIMMENKIAKRNVECKASDPA